MTEAEQLNILTLMVGADVDASILPAYLKLAGAEIINRAFPFEKEEKEVPHKYRALQCEIAAYLINKRGAEGQTGHSENGISRSYENGGIPESLLSRITPMCGIL